MEVFEEMSEIETKVMKDVLDYVCNHPGCSTSDIIERIDASPELVNKALQTLSEKEEIEQACIE